MEPASNTIVSGSGITLGKKKRKTNKKANQTRKQNKQRNKQDNKNKNQAKQNPDNNWYMYIKQNKIFVTYSFNDLFLLTLYITIRR